MIHYFNIVFNIPVNEKYTYSANDDLNCSPGKRVAVKFRNRKMTGFVIEETDKPENISFEIKGIDRVIDEQPLFNEELVELAVWMSKLYMCSIGEALSIMIPGGKRDSKIAVIDDEPEREYKNINLSEKQKSAIDAIINKESGMFYVYGITGSGKTEVFLNAAENVLQKGKSVIYLVPEIALTHQLLEELRIRFGNKIAMLHSELNPSQKLVEWKRIVNGEAKIVIGARSAVFAPVKSLGLVIVDEEHENTYKSGNNPRYHARQIAMKRIAENNAKLIMGSATPSLEAYFLMKKKKLEKLELGERLSGGDLPEIKIINMKNSNSCISRELRQAVLQNHRDGAQSILFLNRRGFSYFFHCKSCGYEMHCKQCSVSLTYHKNINRMKCHYCGYTTPPIEVCPECGSLDVGYSGFGTEKVEEDVRQIFPELKIARVDADTVKKKNMLKNILKDFKGGKIDILLGTQMVSKGLNFPGVKLAGIVLADTGLHLPDFRAEERTHGLIVQVAGRAGRFSKNGKVYIQTYQPENKSIYYACNNDLEGFYENELKMRKMLDFPPFSRLIRFVFRGKDKNRVIQSADNFASLLGDIEGVLGPAECPLTVVSSNHRYQIIIRTNEFNKLHSYLSYLINDKYKVENNVYLEIDIDPLSLL